MFRQPVGLRRTIPGNIWFICYSYIINDRKITAYSGRLSPDVSCSIRLSFLSFPYLFWQTEEPCVGEYPGGFPDTHMILLFGTRMPSKTGCFSRISRKYTLICQLIRCLDRSSQKDFSDTLQNTVCQRIVLFRVHKAEPDIFLV